MRISERKRLASFDIDHYVCSERAALKWKSARDTRKTLYIYGMSGYGKTSLINFMVSDQEVIYVSADTFEPEDLELEDETENITVIVDDLDKLVRNPFFEENKRRINELASFENVWLVLAGRSEVPGWLMPGYFTYNFILIDENDLGFDRREAERYLESWDVELSEDDMDDVEKKSLRYPLLCKIFAMHLKNGEEIDDEMFETAKCELWDYAWEHVYSEWPIEISDAALKLSAIEEFDSELARMIVGEAEIENLLKKIKEIGNILFIRRANGKNSYCIRPMVRESLKYHMAGRMSKDNINRLYFNIGYYYEMNDELIKAIKYYDEIGDMHQMAQVLVKNSRKNPQTANYHELRRYYLRLPYDIVVDNPELMNGLCMLQSLIMNVEESEKWYTELENYVSIHQGSERRLAKKLLFLLDITLPHRGNINLIDILKNAFTLVSARKLIMPDMAVTSGLPSQMNGGKDFCSWSKKDRELAKTIGKILSKVLGRFGNALINLALAESFFEKGEDNFEVMSLIANGRMQADAVDNIDQIFVADGILAWVYIIMEKPYEAYEIMLNLKKKCSSISDERIKRNIDTFIIRIGLYIGKIKEANEWARYASDENKEFITYDRFHYLTKVRIYIMNGRYEAAVSLLQKLLYYADVMKRTYIKIESLMLLSVVQYKMKNDSYMETFGECMELAKEYQFVRILSRDGALIKPLLDRYKGDETDEDKAYLKAVKSEVKRMAEVYPGYLKYVDDALSINDNALLILKLQAEGASNTDIAEKLGINLNTVKYHNKATYKKLGVKDKTSAVTEARKRGLI